MAPQVSEKQHFVASRMGETSTVEHGSIVALFTKVNSFFLYFEKPKLIHSHFSHEKFSFFSSKKPMQLSDFTRTIHNIFFVFLN